MRRHDRIRALGTRSAAEAALIYANMARARVRGVGRWPHERMPPSPPSELFHAPLPSSASPLPQPDTLQAGSAPVGDALPPLWTTPRYLLATIIASPRQSRALSDRDPRARARRGAVGRSPTCRTKVHFNMILESIPDSERLRGRSCVCRVSAATDGGGRRKQISGMLLVPIDTVILSDGIASFSSTVNFLPSSSPILQMTSVSSCFRIVRMLTHNHLAPTRLPCTHAASSPGSHAPRGSTPT
eukprot:COSAG02_NODE_1896_length_10463_cov_8.034253_1_plen_243_part_00